MGLRKLINKATPFRGPTRSESAECEAAIRRHQATAEAATVPHGAEDSRALADALSPLIGTDLQTPPPEHREFFDLGSEPPSAITPAVTGIEDPPKQTESVDAFTAALNALRSTLRESSSAQRPAHEPITETKDAAPSAPLPAPATPIEIHDTAVIASESTSALERMPLPSSNDTFLPADRSVYQEPPALVKSKPGPTARTAVPKTSASIDSALQAVRDAVPGLNLTPPKSDTPVHGRKRPSSDGIPKSVSEDLPKYPARPRMRTCTRCGHETKLRDAKCQKCGHTDESLGILDAVIAGDLVRVEQVLLVRPHLITLRTSRHDWTLLHMAASGGNPKMVDLLIEKGASVNAVNRDGKTPLHYAAGKGHLGIVQILLTHLADASVLYNGKSALDLARKNGHRDVEDLLRQQQPISQAKPL